MQQEQAPIPVSTERPTGKRSAARNRWRRLRLVAWVEILLFLAVALGVDGLGEGNRFEHIAPHPFWVLVLLITVQYGTGAGLLAATAATLAFRVGNLPPQTLNQDFYDYLLQVALQPILWFGAAVLIGELHDRRRREYERVQTLLQETAERERVIGHAFDQMSKLKANLEARVAGQLRTVLTTYNASKAIDKFDTGEVLMGVTELVKSILNPEKFSLFLLNKQHLEAAANLGWMPDDKYAREFESSTVLFQTVVARRRVLCAIDPLDDRLLAGEGILAGPLVAVDTGELVGMLKVEQLGFLDLNPTTVQNFELLCEWIGTAFANARRYEESQHGGAFNLARNMLSATLFERQRQILEGLAQRIDFDLAVVYLRLEGEGLIDHDAVGAFTRSVATAVAGVLRNTDLVFEYRQQGWDYAILMPAMTAAAAEQAVGRLHTAIGELLRAARMRARVQHTIEFLHRAKASPDAG